MTRRRLAPLAALAILLTAGCGAGDESTAGSPQASAAPTQLVMQPAVGEPIVTFSGLVNGGSPLTADLASLDALPNQSLTVMEPFVNESITFTGVGFADLLNAARATGTSVTVHALDDYEVTLDAAALQAQGVVLATRADGKPIDGASGGPIRVVFPDSSENAADTDLWVWSVDQIIVE